jgi:alkanesulfonate monooxygenase SsuD/methylene tetrahydromethanopterin reductase-like flavin-dependent oxidoreductase (luciferase family)
MDFGLFYYCQGRGVPHDQVYAETLDQIVLAEQLGVRECWFAEHHATDYSLLPSPNLMIASAIQRTTRLRFGNYINILPFHNPLRLAAEAAMLDNPRVYQRPHPPLHLVASHPESVARAGSRGWPVAMHFTPTDVVARCVASYREALAGAPAPRGTGPYRPRLLLCRETFVADTPEAADAQGRVALQGFWHLSALRPPPPPPTYSDDYFRGLTERVWGGPTTYDELAALGGMLIGSPEQVQRQVAHLEQIGVDTLLLVASFGGLTHAQVCRSLELFAEAVIAPRHRRADARRPAAV